MKINSKFLRTVFGLAVFVFLLWLVDLRKVLATFSNLSLEIIIYLIFMSIVLIYVSAFKWGLFLEVLGGRVPVWRLFRLYIVGYFANLILPSYLAGDAVRSWYVGRAVGQHEALAATILERYTGLVAMISLGIAASFLRSFVPWQIKVSMILIGLGLAAVFMVALSTRAIGFLERYALLRPMTKHLFKIQEALNLARRDYNLVAKAMLFSFIYHLLTVVNTIVAANAVGWDNPPFFELVVVLPLILVIGAIPISPNGLGLQEGAWIFFLQAVGASPAVAMGIAIVLRAKSYLIALFGYFFWLAEKRPTICTK